MAAARGFDFNRVDVDHLEVDELRQELEARGVKGIVDMEAQKRAWGLSWIFETFYEREAEETALSKKLQGLKLSTPQEVCLSGKGRMDYRVLSLEYRLGNRLRQENVLPTCCKTSS